MKKTLLEKGVPLNKLEGFLNNSLTFEKLGFTKEAANIFAEELNKTGMSPENGAHRIIALLNKSKSLESATQILKEKESTLSSTVTRLETKKALLNKEVEKKKQEFAGLEEKIRIEILDYKKKLEEFKDEGLKDLKSKLTQKEKDLRSASARLEETNKELEAVEAKSEYLKDKIILGEGLRQILINPDSTTHEQLRRIMEAARKAMDEREKGLLTNTSATDDAKRIIVDIVTEHVKQDLMPKNSYNSLKFINTDLEENLKKLEAENKANLLMISQHSDEKRAFKNELESEMRKMQEALGLEIFLSMMTNYNEVPKPILENLKEVINQAIRDKSGYSIFLRESVKSETLQWYHKNYKNRPRDKPIETIGHLRLVSKPQDDT